MTQWLLAHLNCIHKAGAHFAAIASNTPHIVFEELQQQTPLPLISIVEQTCRKAVEIGSKNIGLMGTLLTMKADFYKKPFLKNNINIMLPDENEQNLIHHKLFTEIELGIFKDDTRDALLSIAKRMIDEQGIDSLILGCTELPLILPDEAFGIPFLNTTSIHCQSIVEYCLDQG